MYRDFEDTVQARVEKDPEFRQALIEESTNHIPIIRNWTLSGRINFLIAGQIYDSDDHDDGTEIVTSQGQICLPRFAESTYRGYPFRIALRP